MTKRQFDFPRRQLFRELRMSNPGRMDFEVFLVADTLDRQWRLEYYKDMPEKDMDGGPFHPITETCLICGYGPLDSKDEEYGGSICSSQCNGIMHEEAILTEEVDRLEFEMNEDDRKRGLK